MRIKNARIFQNGSFVPGGIEFDGKITAVGAGLATEELPVLYECCESSG